MNARSTLLIAHLSDSHLRDDADLRAFEHQLDRIVTRAPDHLVLSGDLLDRWQPALLESALDALAARELLVPGRTTIIHGNHDLASSGGHPRSRSDIARLVLRAWDLPPVIAARRRRFYGAIERRAPGVAGPPPFVKDLGAFFLAALDSVPVPWFPLAVRGGRVQGRHGAGRILDRDLAWLSALPRLPGVLVLHHYPLAVAPFRWRNGPFEVSMEIPADERAALWTALHAAGVRLVLCGHVHRARLDWHEGIAVGLQGQSGAAWAGRPIGWYRIDAASASMEMESTA
ncbi:MAG: metallophosphoesterase [Vicinamibacterales bacterium]